jgi:hypothetical protein
MKKFRIILGFVALLFAFGGALASSLLVPTPGHVFINNPGTQPDECRFISQCDTQGTVPCTVEISGVDVQLRSKINATTCGTLLQRIPD